MFTDMAEDDTASPRSVGGAAGERGGQFRADVAAWFLVHSATGRPVPKLDLRSDAAVPTKVKVETDSPIDDLEVGFSRSNRGLIQTKAGLNLSTDESSPFGEAVAQWCEQAQGGMGDEDRLVIATGKASKPILNLAAALNRRRDPLAGLPSAVEKKSLAVLEAHLSGLEASVRERLLDHASILVLDIEHEGSGDAGVAIEMLNGSVVKSGQGQRAFRCIRDRIRTAAVARSGLSLDGMLDALREAGLELISDSEASVASRRVATRAVLDRHVERLQLAARRIDLRILGVDAEPIEGQDMTDLDLEPSAGPEATFNPKAESAIRRRGRVLLVGLPGSGKTTLLRQLAAKTAEWEGSVSVRVDLTRILKLGLDGDPLQTLIEAVSDDVPSADRDLLGEAIRNAGLEGTLFLGLDGLDETRDRRTDVVSWIDRLIAEVHPEVEIVLATRASAYASAATLGFHELKMGGLRQPDLIARRVLEVLSPDAPPELRAGWVFERLNWVTEAQHETDAANTPLAITILAILAAQSSTDDLPRGRAQMIGELLDRIARSWERRSDHRAQLSGGMTENETTNALLDAFARISWLVVTSRSSLEHTTEEVTDVFIAKWGLPQGRAETLASETIHFWDEAGIVCLAADGFSLEPRVRQLVELGAARHLVALDDFNGVIDVVVSDETLHEVAALAAALDSKVAPAGLDRANAHGHQAVIAIGRGCLENAPDEETANKLVNMLLDGAPPGDDMVRAARVVGSLTVSERLQAKILHALPKLLPTDASEVLTALAKANWNTSDHLDALKAVVERGKPKPKGTKGRGFVIDRSPLAAAFDDAVVELAKRSDPSRDDLVYLIETAVGEGTYGLLRRVATQFNRLGLSLKPKVVTSSVDLAALNQVDKKMNEAFLEFLRIVAKRAVPELLTLGQRRRLHSLARLLKALLLSDSHPRDLDIAVEEASLGLEKTIGLITHLAEIDVGQLAGEAESALVEIQAGMRVGSMFLLLTDALEPARYTNWGNVDATVGELIQLFESTRWIALVAATALQHVPTPSRPQTAARIAEIATGLGPWHRRLASEVAVYLDPTGKDSIEWTNSDDPHLRASASGGVVARRDLEQLKSALTDPDALVCHGALHQLSVEDVSTDADIRALVKTSKSHPLKRRSCHWCGTSNPPKGEPNCRNCGLALPDSTAAANALLSGREPHF